MQKQAIEVQRLSNPFVFDFHKLACLEPDLRPYILILNNRTVCNFKDQNSLVAVTRAILKHYFNLQWNCPPSNLCPRVPARLNYLLWIYLKLSHTNIRTVLDIGTGATLIYPLLGHSLFKWKFIATELSKESYQHSQILVELNGLQQEIDLRLLEQNETEDDPDQKWKDDLILEGVIGVEEEIDVVICNPPFFDEDGHTLTRMTQGEHHTEGGQYAFFFSLYRQSYNYPRIGYFSCLIGLSSNFQIIKTFLLEEYKDGFLKNLHFGEIHQGSSRRHIVLWKILHKTHFQ